MNMNAFLFECILFLFSLSFCTGLYEDQIGKFEWRQQYVGKLKYSHLDIVSPTKKVIVASEQNVLAALSLKSGDILWRQLLEQGENSNIKFLYVDNEIITVSGQSNLLCRGWELENGHLLWEWSLTPSNVFTKWLVIGSKFIQIDFYSKSHIDVTLYLANNGRKLRSQNVPTTWLVPEKCVVQSDHIACLTNDKQIYAIKLTDGKEDIEIKVHHRSLLDLFREQVTGELKTTEGPLPVVTIKAGGVDQLLNLAPELEVVKTEPFDLIATFIADQNKYTTSVNLNNGILEVITSKFGGEPLPGLTSKVPYPNTFGVPDFATFACQSRRDRDIACRLLISTSHHVIGLMQHPGKLLWSREESLASITTVDMINLPVSDTDAAIEKEFDSKDRGFVGMFFRRLVSQTLQLQNLVLTVMGLRGAVFPDEKEGLIRDEFGLHKIIVAVTAAGKIFGIDNLSGTVVWQIKVDGVEPFSSIKSAPLLPLFTLRTARHFPYPAQCAVLVKDQITKEGVLVVFNPINGLLVDPENKVIKLGFKVKQTLMLQHANDEFSKGIIFLDEEDNVHVYPEQSKSVALSQAASTFIFTADAETGILEGYTLAYSTKERLKSTKIWQLRLAHGNDKIIALVGKNNHERVHSQGRVLGDRSVLYKYVNPNLVAIVTKGYHPSHKGVLNLHLVDVVSGNIVFSATHRKAKEPVHVVHSENWLVYTYFSEKYRRTELAALEMYEGKTQSNATAFSSVESATLLPIVERQAYILPANVLALKETITEKGITSKHILVALASGGILELPWVYVDPRRPLTVTPEMREEGVIPYMPELPILYEAIINHNQTVSNVREIHTSSSGLESTCLVFAYGLDIFYTRVAPSKTFDLLKEDFDYYLITTVLVALTAISYITKKLASRKALKQAWK